MRALYSTVGARVVAADAYVVKMIALRQVFHRLRKARPLSVTISQRDPHWQRISS
jgi:hypothetical protein